MDAGADEADDADADEVEDAQSEEADETSCGCGGMRKGDVVMTVTACGLSSSISDVSSASAVSIVFSTW
jgi:hypothetical protein